MLLRAFTRVDAYERTAGRRRARAHTWSAAAATGPSSRSRTCCTLLGVIANPLDDEALFGALASPACGVTPDTLWLLRRVALGRRERGFSTRLWPALREVVAGEVPAEGDGQSWAEAIGEDEIERLRRFVEQIEPLRSDAPLLGLEGTIERSASAWAMTSPL